ncbi:MAG: hypothetical protein PVF60_11595 [Desulfobacterales bacterium]|jgi:hypothetical protein
MKNLNHRTFGIFLALLVTLFMMSCASEPVSVDLPANHPANPQGEESAFNPPPNPFQNNNPAVVHQSESSSSMTHEEHQSAQPHQMNPKMDKMRHGSDSSQASEAQGPEHEHKEDHQ